MEAVRTRTAWCSSPGRRGRARRRRCTRPVSGQHIDVQHHDGRGPVEYNLFGINQVLVRTEIGMTFAAALKAFLRQDPNIIMVGEIRDLETGGIAIKAALTGHLVLSTLHTNSTRRDGHPHARHGLEPFNVASALNLVLAQRLVRRICKQVQGAARVRRRQGHRDDGAALHDRGAGGCEVACAPDALPHLANLSQSCIGHPLLQGARVRRLQRDGAQGPGRALRGHVHDPVTAPLILMNVGARRSGRRGRGRDADAAHGRHAQEVSSAASPRSKKSSRDDAHDDGLRSMTIRCRPPKPPRLLEEMIERGRVRPAHHRGRARQAPHRRRHRRPGRSVLSPKDTLQLAYSVLTENQKKRFEMEDELDFSFGIQNLARFRGNCFKQRGCVSMVIRRSRSTSRRSPTSTCRR
jgi:hypothetical protein